MPHKELITNILTEICDYAFDNGLNPYEIICSVCSDMLELLNAMK